jgi:hypothetical protein
MQDVDGSKNHAHDFGALSNSDTPASALGRSSLTLGQNALLDRVFRSYQDLLVDAAGKVSL